MKEKTSCDINDYQCMYWQTSYQYSDTQIACYTPKVPESDRDKLQKATANSAQMKISLEVVTSSTIFTLNCASTSDCLVIYHPNMTANLVSFSPAHFYIGQTLTMKVYPKSGTYDNLLGVKIGRNNCDPQVITGSSNGYGELLLNCLTMDNYVPEKITDFNINFLYGYSSVPFYFQKSDVDTTLMTNSKFFFKAFPRIDSITQNKGVNIGGQAITIKGAGFTTGKTKVYVNNDECTEGLNVQGTNLVSCTTPTSTINPANTNLNLGSNGLRWRTYSLTSGSITALNSLAGFPDNSTVITKDDILLETMTPKTFTTNYGQYINGYFKAPYSGTYTFWLTSDDASQVYLSTDSTSANKKLLIDYTSWSDYNDFITKNIKSNATTLVGGSYYYMEVKHVQGGGNDHFGLGVEIATTGIDFTNTTKPLPNQIPRTVKIQIAPKVSRNLYEVVINSLTAGTYKFTCKSSDGTSTKSIDIDPNKTAAQLLSAIAGLTGQSELIIRKVGYNDAKLYFLNSTETADDASYTTNYGFSDMYVSANITTVSTGTKTGSVLLILVDRKISDTSYAWENNCYLSTAAASTITISKKQVVSTDITGNFTIKVNDTSTGTVITTPDIDITNFSADGLRDILNYIPVLTNKIQVFVSKSLETVNLFFRLSPSISTSFEVVTTALKGGRDDIPTATITEFMPSSNNLFFFPIPADFLYVQSNK
jgi:hypothetical protein